MFEREYRDLSHVPRWGIIPVIKRQSVAEHSYYVTLYTHHICIALDISWEVMWNAVRHGLEHDRSESYTSDIPGPVKRAMVDPMRELGYETVQDNARFELQKYNTDRAAVAIRKLADLMDEYAYWCEEESLGNKRSPQMKKIVMMRLLDASEIVGKVTKNENRMRRKVLDPFFYECDHQEKCVPEEPK